MAMGKGRGERKERKGKQGRERTDRPRWVALGWVGMALRVVSGDARCSGSSLA